MRIPPAFAFTACAFIWGTTWLAIKWGYGGLDAVWGASIRFLIAGALMIPLLMARSLAPPRGVRHIGVVLYTGVVMFALDYGLIYWGEQFVPSGLTAILFATMPLFVGVFNAIIIPNEPLTRRHGLGILIGLAGLVLVFQQELTLKTASVAGMLAIVVAAAAAASTSVVVRRWGRDLAPITLNASSMMIGGVILFAASQALGETASAPRNGRAWFSLLYLVVLGSIVSFLLFWDLLKKWGANRAGLVPLVTPVVAVTTGVLVGERLGPLQWVGSLVVIAGVAIALLPMRSAARAQAASPTTGK